jgi:hypothetical protein
MDGVKLEGGPATLNLSAEVMAWPSPSQGAAQVRFAVLAKEPGLLQIKLYNEAGQGVGQVEGPAARVGYAKLAWDCSQAQPGQLLWQATLTATAGGKVTKYPIRKLQISR